MVFQIRKQLYNKFIEDKIYAAMYPYQCKHNYSLDYTTVVNFQLYFSVLLVKVQLSESSEVFINQKSDSHGNFNYATVTKV